LKKIIIIEDDADTLDMMEFILRDNGYAVIKANRLVSIEEFISIMPDLAILDIMLPYGFGNDICLQIKTNPKSKHIPVILYSASSNLKTLAKNSLADAYIEKPFDLNKLLEIVKATIL
jgi:two-component system phosphate regulon response regulator PhoB